MEKSPSEDFAPLAFVFRLRLLPGVGSASLVALGANFAGITSLLLGLSPETGRNLKLDVVYPVSGCIRCIGSSQVFEFIYPANCVGDQTLLYRVVGKAESQRSLGKKMPRMLENDAIARYYGLEKGQVLKVSYNSEITGSHVTYRCVV